MGWSESYYCDWRDQGKRELRRKAADFLEAADDFFEGLGQERDILDIDINRYTALWREVREMIERDLLE
jgi:hypothetical protein